MIGTILSHYLIEAELGRGGMGIVYRAQDTKLDRTVAIKVLPAAALASQEDRARFYREAKAAAALNHPNIAQIHQIDEAIARGADARPIEASDGPRPFIAMEFIEGGTLENRIKAGPLKLNEAIRIATQIAEALKAAHAKEIVHRDIKSANIMLTKDGQAKVLDFGLAQTSHSTKLTRMGSTLGTVAYMSPEQARGEEVDGRTDLYSLGTVLYEMVAGRLPFGGEYEQAVVYSILNAEPEPLTALRTGVPMELERITNKLLAKDAGRRYQTAADLIADLSHVDAPSLTSTVHQTRIEALAPVPGTPRPGWLLPALVLASLLIGAMITWMTIPGPAPAPVERLVLDMDGMRMINSIGISPDSRYIAMTGYDWDGKEGLFLYDVAAGTVNHVERSEGAYFPWFSPSGTQVAFSGYVGNRGLYLMDVPTGAPRKVLDLTWTSYWLDEDHILYTSTNSGRDLKDKDFEDRGSNFVYSISEESSTIVSGTERAVNGSDWFFSGPRLPNSNLSIGNVQGMASFGIDPYLYVMDVEKRAIEETETPGLNAQPLTEDIMLYQVGDDGGRLIARRIDPKSGTFLSTPIDVLEDVFFALFQTETNTGSLVFSIDNLPDQQLVSVLDLTTKELVSYDVAGSDGEVSSLHLSSDGRELIASIFNGETGLTKIISIDLETDRQVTRAEDVPWLGLDRLQDNRLLISRYEVENKVRTRGRQLLVVNPDGRSSADTLSVMYQDLVFGSQVPGGYIVSISDEVGLLHPNGSDFTPFAPGTSPSVSANGRFVVFMSPQNVMSIFDRQTNRLNELTRLRGSDPQFSTDGRFLYFYSFEGLPAKSSQEADLVRIPIRLENGFELVGEPEFLMHVYHPALLDLKGGKVAMLTEGDVSLDQPARRSARIGWWRNLSTELDASLPR